jgi:hypothetical protein
MRGYSSCLWSIGAAIVGSACVAVEAPPAGEDDGARVALAVADWRGREAAADAAPRRPRLRLDHAGGFSPIEDSVLLLRGAADAELLDDLARAPLLAAHRARGVASRLTFFGDGVGVLPGAPLEIDADYTLAIASWARSSRGERIGEGTPVTFALHTDAGDGAGARALSSWPADGAAGVGTNLAAAYVVFDGSVDAGSDGVWLEDPSGAAVDASLDVAPCAEIAPEQAGASCARITPAARLWPSAAYALVVGAKAVDAHGAPVGPFRARFQTAGGRDTLAPALGTAECAIDEQDTPLGCALIDDVSATFRVRADEPVALALRGGDHALYATSADGNAVLRVADLPPDSALALELTLTDAAGNRTRASMPLRTLPALATLAISELRADPLGPEPQQEFVELWNYGARAIDLAGFSLGDRLDKPAESLPPQRVEPAARVLLVADGFDPHEARDVQPPPGATLVRAGKALTGSGLSNAGERLYLRDPEGRRVSAAPAGPTPRAGACSARVGGDPRDGSEGAFDYAPCSPGR